MVNGDLGQRRPTAWSGVVFVVICAGAFLLVTGCATYFVINLMT
jgi:hypothetical protein